MKEAVLRLLQEEEDYISGQKICQILGVSRTAVWKDIEQLKSEGYQIEAVRNRGYHLVNRGDVFSKFEIEHRMKTKFIGRDVRFYDVIDSTNLEIKRIAETKVPQGVLAVADCQESGRGRLGRVWTSPSGCGLWMSLLLRPDFSPEIASMTTLLAALAVMDAVEEISGVQSQIKWPNDLVANGRKICGILTEMGLEESRISYIVPGIGINCNNESFPEELADKAISLFMLTGKKIDRAALAAAVCNHFEKYYEDFLKYENLSFCLEKYNSHLINLGNEVVIMDRLGSRSCISRGINAYGALVVENPDGKLEEISSGEVSVRGIYGYV